MHNCIVLQGHSFKQVVFLKVYSYFTCSDSSINVDFLNKKKPVQYKIYWQNVTFVILT